MGHPEVVAEVAAVDVASFEQVAHELDASLFPPAQQPVALARVLVSDERGDRGSFLGADVRLGRATVQAFAAPSRSPVDVPQSSFVTTCSVQRRDAPGVDKLTGCVLHRIDGHETPPRTLESRSDWLDVLDEVFDLPLDDPDDADRGALWARVRAAHESWLAHRRLTRTSSRA
jgi:hypothetical protein